MKIPFLTLVAALAAALVLPGTASAAANATARDDHSDFNFLFGKWHTHYRLLKKRLSGDHDWYDCYGTSEIRPFWNGSANLEDGDLKCPNRYVHGMTLRLYDPATHQWSLYWGTTKLGLTLPQQVGHFENGVGDFFANDTYQGKPVVVRFRWTVLDGNPHFEQAFSPDKGKTWETNWTTDYTKM